jgi:hypothetical protein
MRDYYYFNFIQREHFYICFKLTGRYKKADNL